MMQWDDARFVLALAHEGSLSRAAIALEVTHTTVARRVRALEDALGVRLFDKIDGAYVPTAGGQDVVDVGERLRAEFTALQNRVRGKDLRLEGELRIATMDILLPRLEPALSSFMAVHPGIDVTLLVSDDSVSLVRRETDIALRMTNAPEDHLIGRQVGEVRFGFYAQTALAHQLGADAPLSAFPWLHWDKRLQPKWLDALIAAHAPGAKVALRVDARSRDLQELVAAGLGVHPLARHMGDADPRLKRVGDLDEVVVQTLWLLYLREMRTNSKVRAFVDHILELGLSQAPDDEG